VRLSGLAEGIHGAVGNMVFLRSVDGAILRAWDLPSDPRTNKQVDARNAMRRASSLWGELSPEEMEAWRLYAEARAVRSPGMPPRVPSPLRLFVGLSIKLLQMGVAVEELPRTPPVGPFPGDGILVSAAPGATDEPSFMDAQLSASIGGPETGELEPSVLFSADAPNRIGVVTELLTQELRRPYYRTYREKYRTGAFHAFTDATPTAAVHLPMRGYYACAYRFVEAASGRMTDLTEIGVVSV
jgi:hypothetical protein